MTTFQPETGRLRTTTADFVRFLAHLQGATTGRDAGVDVADLVALGVLDGKGAPHRHLAPAASAALAPLVKLRVRVSAPQGTVVHPGWAHLEAAAVLAGVGEDSYDLVTVNPPHLPSVIARLVGLGPRPVQPDAVFEVDATLADSLLAEDPDGRTRGASALAASLPRDLDGWRSALAAGAWKCWEARTAWEGPAGPAVRRVVAVDSPAGFLLLPGEVAVRQGAASEGAAGEGAVREGAGRKGSAGEGATRHAATTTPARIWAALVHLMPEADEIVTA